MHERVSACARAGDDGIHTRELTASIPLNMRNCNVFMPLVGWKGAELPIDWLRDRASRRTRLNYFTARRDLMQAKRVCEKEIKRDS